MAFTNPRQKGIRSLSTQWQPSSWDIGSRHGCKCYLSMKASMEAVIHQFASIGITGILVSLHEVHFGELRRPWTINCFVAKCPQSILLLALKLTTIRETQCKCWKFEIHEGATWFTQALWHRGAFPLHLGDHPQQHGPTAIMFPLAEIFWGVQNLQGDVNFP